jgi:S-adenosyl methyltransferase
VGDAGDELYQERGVDLDRPNVARVYDFYLGGTANWAVDREFGKRVIERYPVVRPIAMANRLFLHRVVRHLARLGVRQFVDIGAGVPTVGNTHSVADEIAPGSRVVYIDHEPVAVAHSTILLEQHGDPARHAAINADLRDPESLWERTMATGLINLDEPLAVLLIAVLHIGQPGPDGTDVTPDAVAQYRDLLPSGSYLAISHSTNDGLPEDVKKGQDEFYRLSNAGFRNGVIFRSRPEIEALFGDFELLEPGMCWTPQWHPEETGPNSPVVEFGRPSESMIWAGVGRKR